MDRIQLAEDTVYGRAPINSLMKLQIAQKTESSLMRWAMPSEGGTCSMERFSYLVAQINEMWGM
jgi:hypothetical protein